LGADQSIESQGAGDLGAVPLEAVAILAFILSESSPDLRFWCNLKLKYQLTKI